MTKYESLLAEAEHEDVIVHENFNLSGTRLKGLYCDSTVAINKDIPTTSERACVLAEELGHHYTAAGDITDQNSVANRKQEYHGRLYAYNRLVGLYGIISAYKHGCRNRYEISDCLGVTEKFFSETLNAYKSKYGLFTTVDNYVIYFEPLGVLELYE